MEEFWLERYELVTERIREIEEEQILPKEWQAYFASEAKHAEMACEYLAFVRSGGLETATLPQLQEWNQRLYKEWQSVQGECAPFMELMSAELRSLGFLATQNRLEEFLIRLELFAEIYGICVYEWLEEKKLPDYKSLQECLYWYANDYADVVPLRELQYLQYPEENPVYQLLQRWDLEGETCLYKYGTMITAGERSLYEWLGGLPLEEVETWAEKLAEEIRKLMEEDTQKVSDKRIFLQYPIGYEKVVYTLIKKLQEQDVKTVPEIAGMGLLLRLYEEDFQGGKVLWDKALAKRCREIKQTLTEKTEKENQFCFVKVVLKEAKNEILKPHVV